MQLVKKGEPFPSHLAKAALREALLRRCAVHHRITSGGQVAVRKGAAPTVQVIDTLTPARHVPSAWQAALRPAPFSLFCSFNERGATFSWLPTQLIVTMCACHALCLFGLSDISREATGQQEGDSHRGGGGFPGELQCCHDHMDGRQAPLAAADAAACPLSWSCIRSS
jgi:hypothetical protein